MAIRDDLITAIDLALSGNWDEAHRAAQHHEGDEKADLLHAILHIQEGDEDNAMYWYRRVGITEKPDGEPEKQLANLRAELVAKP
ncbi:MAG: hypothetical protein K0U74_17100 [Alphaproteobacteria bacterium]|nr:hypothetical protein [Alphaproteobacteria bacterium]